MEKCVCVCCQYFLVCRLYLNHIGWKGVSQWTVKDRAAKEQNWDLCELFHVLFICAHIVLIIDLTFVNFKLTPSWWIFFPAFTLSQQLLWMQISFKSNTDKNCKQLWFLHSTKIRRTLSTPGCGLSVWACGVWCAWKHTNLRKHGIDTNIFACFEAQLKGLNWQILLICPFNFWSCACLHI